MKISQSTLCDKHVIEALAGLNKPLGTKAKLQKLHIFILKCLNEPPVCSEESFLLLHICFPQKAALQLNVCKAFWLSFIFEKCVQGTSKKISLSAGSSITNHNKKKTKKKGSHELVQNAWKNPWQVSSTSFQQKSKHSRTSLIWPSNLREPPSTGHYL